MNPAFLHVIIITAFASSAIASRCPRGWTYLVPANRCYLYVAQSVAWQEASRICESIGGSLPILRDRETDDALREYAFAMRTEVFRGHREESYNIGLQRNAAEQWQWLDGRPLTYSNWLHNEPGTTSYRCAASFDDFDHNSIASNASYGNRWISQKCEGEDAVQRVTICERPLLSGNGDPQAATFFSTTP